MIRLTLLWLCCFPALVAGEGASCHSAGCEEFDETSLLQLSHAKRQINQPNAAQPEEVQPAQNVAKQNQIAPDVNLVKMSKLVSDMERRRGGADGDDGGDDGSGDGDADGDAGGGNGDSDGDDGSGDGGSWGDSEKMLLETLKTSLQNQFIPFLTAEHNDDERDYNAHTAVHNLCTKHNFDDNDAVAVASTSMLAKRDKHRACRKSQKSWNDYKSLALRHSSCAEESDIPDMHEVYDKHEALAVSMEDAKTQAQAYANLAPADTKRDCAQDQQAYEDQWCAWRASKDESCTGLSRCIEQVDLNGLKTRLEARARNRQMLWDTVLKLQCRINHLLSTFNGADTSAEDTSAEDTSAEDASADDTSADNCTEATDITRFVLSLDVPQHASCSNAGDAIEPTTSGSTCSDWIAQQYSAGEGWSPTTHVVPPACQTSCSARTVTAPPALHEGCAEDRAGCVFYNAHPDACGVYDSGSDVQSTDCCACGAEPTSSSGPSPGDLVVFDEHDPALTVSPGSLTGSGLSNWNHHAISDHQVMASQSICGISFKCDGTAKTSSLFVGIASTEVTSAHHSAIKALDYAIKCEDTVGRMQQLWARANGCDLSHQGPLYLSQDVHALRVSEGGGVEYSVNGAVYWTSTSWTSTLVPVTYPWHVVVDTGQNPSLSEMRYLEC